MLMGREVGSVFPCRIVALGKTEMPLDLATQDIFTCTRGNLSGCLTWMDTQQALKVSCHSVPTFRTFFHQLSCNTLELSQV